MLVVLNKDIKITEESDFLWLYADEEVYYDYTTGIAYHLELDRYFVLNRRDFYIWN